MSVSLNRLSTTIVAVAVIAAALGPGSALGATPPAGMSVQEYKAQVIRGQALNDLYGAAEVKSWYPAYIRAERLRGEAMNRLARSGVFSTPTPVASDGSAGDGFDWSDFGIGVAAMFGFVLLVGALAGATLYARRGQARAHAA
jgi:hypothetical protein